MNISPCLSVIAIMRAKRQAAFLVAATLGLGLVAPYLSWAAQQSSPTLEIVQPRQGDTVLAGSDFHVVVVLRNADFEGATIDFGEPITQIRILKHVITATVPVPNLPGAALLLVIKVTLSDGTSLSDNVSLFISS
jgi:hypothetical protein